MMRNGDWKGDDSTKFRSALLQAAEQPLAIGAWLIAKGNKRQISLTIAPELLRKVDEVAMRMGQARAAVINLAIFRVLEGDFVELSTLKIRRLSIMQS